MTKKVPDIIKTIEAGARATLIKLAIHLKAQKLITTAIHNQAKEAPIVLGGADMLMTAVEHEVKKNQTNFIKFLAALRNSDLNDEADMLERECGKFGKKL